MTSYLQPKDQDNQSDHQLKWWIAPMILSCSIEKLNPKSLKILNFKFDLIYWAISIEVGNQY